MDSIYLTANRGRDFLLVGIPSLVYNGLMYGNVNSEPLVLYTPYSELDGVLNIDVHLEHNHFNDSDFVFVFSESNNLWLPTPERAIIDTIAFLNYNYIEGPLIESLQNYMYKRDDYTELYKVAEHYNVSRDTVDYWLKEAREESDMSMG